MRKQVRHRDALKGGRRPNGGRRAKGWWRSLLREGWACHHEGPMLICYVLREVYAPQPSGIPHLPTVDLYRFLSLRDQPPVFFISSRKGKELLSTLLNATISKTSFLLLFWCRQANRDAVSFASRNDAPQVESNSDFFFLVSIICYISFFHWYNWYNTNLIIEDCN